MVCVTKLCVKDGVSKMVGDKVSEAPATQNEPGCEFAPRLPRDIKVNVETWREPGPAQAGLTIAGQSRINRDPIADFIDIFG